MLPVARSYSTQAEIAGVKLIMPAKHGDQRGFFSEVYNRQAFEKAGFWIVRQGKHVTMTNGEKILTIPRNNPINASTLAAIIRGAGISIDEFRKLL